MVQVEILKICKHWQSSILYKLSKIVGKRQGSIQESIFGHKNYVLSDFPWFFRVFEVLLIFSKNNCSTNKFSFKTIFFNANQRLKLCLLDISTAKKCNWQIFYIFISWKKRKSGTKCNYKSRFKGQHLAVLPIIIFIIFTMKQQTMLQSQNNKFNTKSVID